MDAWGVVKCGEPGRGVGVGVRRGLLAAGWVGAAGAAAAGAEGWSLVEWVVQPVTARAAAKMTAPMIRTGRMGTSPSDCATGVVQTAAWPRPVTAGPRPGIAATARRTRPSRDHQSERPRRGPRPVPVGPAGRPLDLVPGAWGGPRFR